MAPLNEAYLRGNVMDEPRSTTARLEMCASSEHRFPDANAVRHSVLRSKSRVGQLWWSTPRKIGGPLRGSTGEHQVLEEDGGEKIPWPTERNQNARNLLQTIPPRAIARQFYD